MNLLTCACISDDFTVNAHAHFFFLCLLIVYPTQVLNEFLKRSLKWATLMLAPTSPPVLPAASRRSCEARLQGCLSMYVSIAYIIIIPCRRIQLFCLLLVIYFIFYCNVLRIKLRVCIWRVFRSNPANDDVVTMPTCSRKTQGGQEQC